MYSQHTPGPWFILIDPETDKPAADYGYAVQHDGNIVADSIESEADARTIAAVPLLLDAAKHAARSTHHPACSHAHPHRCTCHVEKAQTALDAIAVATEPTP